MEAKVFWRNLVLRIEFEDKEEMEAFLRLLNLLEQIKIKEYRDGS